MIQGTLGNLGHVAFCRGDRQAARALFEQSLVLARTSGNKAQMALMLNNPGDDALVRGDLVVAQALADESLALSRALGRRNGLS